MERQEIDGTGRILSRVAAKAGCASQCAYQAASLGRPAKTSAQPSTLGAIVVRNTNLRAQLPSRVTGEDTQDV